MTYHLINNNLKILIDPCYFIDTSSIEEQVDIVTMVKDYLKQIVPALCDVQFFYPKFIEKSLRMRSVFFSEDEEVVEVFMTEAVISFINNSHTR